MNCALVVAVDTRRKCRWVSRGIFPYPWPSFMNLSHESKFARAAIVVGCWTRQTPKPERSRVFDVKPLGRSCGIDIRSSRSSRTWHTNREARSVSATLHFTLVHFFPLLFTFSQLRASISFFFYFTRGGPASSCSLPPKKSFGPNLRQSSLAR